jgi:hypothetical protein
MSRNCSVYWVSGAQRRGRRQRFVGHRQQLQGEQFREHHEVAAVVGGDVDEVLDLARELAEVGDPALLVLHGRHPHARRNPSRLLLAADHRVLRALGVAPDQAHAMAERGLVGGQVAGEHARRLETVAQLERERGVARALVDHRVDVVLDALISLELARQPRQPPDEHDPAQVQRFAQPLAAVVQPAADAHPAELGVDADLHPVQPVAVGVVARGEAAAGDLAPGMRRHRQRLVDAERGAVPDHPAVVLGHELAFREMAELAAQHLRRVAVSIDPPGQLDQSGEVPGLHVAEDEAGLGVGLASWHGLIPWSGHE